MILCGQANTWWDVGTTTHCRQEKGHADWHWDGSRFFDELGFQRPNELDVPPGSRFRWAWPTKGNTDGSRP